MNDLIEKINKLWNRVQQIDSIISMQSFKIASNDSEARAIVFSNTSLGSYLVIYNSIIDNLKEEKKQLKIEIKTLATQLGAL